MNECLKNINISLLFILLSLYITSILSEIMYLIDNNYLSKIIFYIILIDAIITAINIIITLLIGCPSLYFSSKKKLIIYIVNIFFFLLIKILYFTYLYIKENISFDYSIINIIFYTISFQIFLLIINFILCLIQRKQLIQEIKEAPLNYVDENMTEEMYKSILNQSLNPDNLELKNEFQKKLELRQKENSRFSSTNSLKSSVKSKQ